MARFDKTPEIKTENLLIVMNHVNVYYMNFIENMVYTFYGGTRGLKRLKGKR